MRVGKVGGGALGEGDRGATGVGMENGKKIKEKYLSRYHKSKNIGTKMHT